jgi:hypothetical protein
MSASLNNKRVLCYYCSWTLLAGGSSMSASLNNKPVLHKYRKELEARESIEKQIRNKFKSKPLTMKNSLVKRQVMKAQSNKHRKAK